MRKKHNLSEEGLKALRKSANKNLKPFTKGHKTNVDRKRSEISKKKQSLAMKGRRSNFYNNNHTEAAKEKISNANKNRILPPWTDERRKKTSERMKGNQHAKGNHFKQTEEFKNKVRERNINYPNKKFKNTKIELKIHEELKKRNFIEKKDYFRNYPLLKMFNVDFYFPNKKIVIECDGDYWHNRKDVKMKDLIKNRKLKENGFNLYRFWEHEIHNSPAECVNKIFETIKL